jgi:hypothetical protein
MNYKQEKQVTNIFNVCDLDGSGDIDRHELRLVCDHLNNEQIDKVFDSLDINKDGLISYEEFSRGFNEIDNKAIKKPSKNVQRVKTKNEIYEKNRKYLREHEAAGKDLTYDSTLFAANLDYGFKLLSW